MYKALFLDRDGVINKEVEYLYKIGDFKFISGVFETCKYFMTLKYRIFVITNQAGIARGLYSEKDFYLLNTWMLEQFSKQSVFIDKVYYSPYHPEYGQEKYKIDSWCRKPNPGMILQAKQDFSLDLEQSILVGDKESDIIAGIRAGIGLNILVRSGHPINEETSKASLIIDSVADLVGFIPM